MVSIPYKRVTNGDIEAYILDRDTFQSPISGSQTEIPEKVDLLLQDVSIPYKRVTNLIAKAIAIALNAMFQSPISGSQTILLTHYTFPLLVVSIPYKRVTNTLSGAHWLPRSLVSIPYKRVTNQSKKNRSLWVR